MIEFDDSKGMLVKEIKEVEEFTKFKLTKKVIELFSNYSGGEFKNNKSYIIQ